MAFPVSRNTVKAGGKLKKVFESQEQLRNTLQDFLHTHEKEKCLRLSSPGVSESLLNGAVWFKKMPLTIKWNAVTNPNRKAPVKYYN